LKKLFKCTVCGFVWEGTEAPEKCPKCLVPKDKFVELSKEEADKIYSSTPTNDIHIEIIHLATKIAQLCDEGIKMELDAKCVTSFEQTKNEAWTIKQRAKAEIAGHVSNGKW